MSAIEHASVMSPLVQYAAKGRIDLQVCPVNQKGFLDLDALDDLLTGNTRLISVMLANNEVGSIQPLSDVVVRAKTVGALVHSDIVQAVGKMPVNLEAIGADAVTVSSHKCYAPTGWGALIVKHLDDISPMVLGGSQQQMLRGGTVNVFGTVLFEKGLRYCYSELPKAVDISSFVSKHLRKLPHIEIISAPDQPNQLWNTVSLAFKGVDAHDMLIRLDLEGIAVSSGSACSTGAVEVSSVIEAMGVSSDIASSVIRMSFGYMTTQNDLDYLLNHINTPVKK